MTPWQPELFSAPALERVWEDERRRQLNLVPFFPGLMTGETGALVESFAGEPEVHHPIRGRVRGVAAFERFVAETRRWVTEHDVTVEDVGFVLTPERGVEELVLRGGDFEVPVAIASDHAGGGIAEVRVYFSSWPRTRRHAVRPPLLQPDGAVTVPDVVGDHQRALAVGDVEAAVAAFEPDGTLREPAGGAHVHHGTEALRELYARFFSGGGVALEHCALTDDGRACALEYNVVGWGRAAMQPQAGIAIYVRGESGRLAAARIYDDAEPPIGDPRR